jgi:hypothetical protein
MNDGYYSLKFFSRDFKVLAQGIDWRGEKVGSSTMVADFAFLAPALANDDTRRTIVEKLAERYAQELSKYYEVGWDDGLRAAEEYSNAEA